MPVSEYLAVADSILEVAATIGCCIALVAGFQLARLIFS